MLVIRDAQMRVLALERKDEFEELMLRRIKAEFPERSGDFAPDELRAFLRRAGEAAARLGVVMPDARAAFVELVLEYGEAFERAPERGRIHKILQHPSLPGDVKVFAIQDRIARQTSGRRLVLFHPEPSSNVAAD